MEIQNRLQQFLRKYEPNPTHTKSEKAHSNQPNPTQPMANSVAKYVATEF